MDNKTVSPSSEDCFCRNCGQRLPSDQPGRCPYCGHTGRVTEIRFSTVVPSTPADATTKPQDVQESTEPPIDTPFEPISIGRCVYCGNTDELSDEHIVPYGLGGRWKLREASCPTCRDITSNFEMDVQRRYFMMMRTTLGLPTRHPDQRPRSFDLAVDQAGRAQTLNVSADDTPTMFIMPTFARPGYLDGNISIRGLVLIGWSLHGRGSELDAFRAAHPVDSVSFSAPLSVSFGRMLAKIGYCMVVHKYGLNSIEEAFVLPSILGTKDDVGCWVGCDHIDSPDLLPNESWGHRIVTMDEGNIAATRIRLFASFKTPEYLVIVGKLRAAC